MLTFHAARVTIDVHGTVRDTTAFPLGIERSIDARDLTPIESSDVSGDLTLIERSTVLHDLPCVIVEWQADSTAGPRSVRLDADLRLDPSDVPNQLEWSTGDGSLDILIDGIAVSLLSHRDTRFAVHPSGAGIRCSAALPLGPAPVRLVVACALTEGDDFAAILDAARNANGRLLARNATLRRRDRDCLALSSSEPGYDRLVRSAVHRLDAVPIMSPPRLATPDGLADSLHRRTPARALPAPDNLMGDPCIRLAVAALAAGESAVARDIFASLPADSNGQLAAVIRAWAGDDHPDRQLDDAQPPDLAGAPPSAGDAARRIVAGDPMHADSVSGPILGLVLNILGADPDASRGRIRLRPVLPAAWDHFEVRNLPMADARIRIRTARRGNVVEIEIEQTDGAIPIRAILEPVVQASALIGATVDGQPASLTARPLGNRIQVPVQLALDHTRRLVLELA
ncbi:MAG TPA: hypothetical protein VMM79_05500 [Longimicrobiales bacterium]|nr:hypothetical protein [Longimicrobiales bacterium]